MIAKLLKAKLNKDGYLEIPVKDSAFSSYLKIENSCINIILLADYREGTGFTYEECEKRKDELLNSKNDGQREIHLITIYLCNNAEPDINDYMSWVINCRTGQLIIKDENIADFYGLKGYLEEFLVSSKALIASGDMQAIERSLRSTEENLRYDKLKEKKPAPAVIIFVTINVIIFLTQFVVGDAFTESGYMDSIAFQNGEFYRLFTAMFLHGDVTHLFSNMILLYFMGEMIEHLIGTPKTAVIYLISGLFGNVVSYGYHMIMNDPYSSLGASGAVYGLIGTTLFLAIIKLKGLNIPIRRMVILVIYCIYSSIVGNNIDVGAHIGGLIAGFVLAAILCRQGGKKSES